jgi:hypothetical protein
MDAAINSVKPEYTYGPREAAKHSEGGACITMIFPDEDMNPDSWVFVERPKTEAVGNLSKPKTVLKKVARGAVSASPKDQFTAADAAYWCSRGASMVAWPPEEDVRHLLPTLPEDKDRKGIVRRKSP